MLTQLKKTWFFNVRADVLAGITVALALIPEAIAFSIIAGVDPMVGLYASFCIAVVIAFVGGRPGMISAATGAMALVMVTLVKEHGLDYLLAATVLTGLIQLLLGVFKAGKIITFIPQPVIIGFVNALAILIFMAQLTQFEGATWLMYVLVAVTLAIIYLLPLVTRAVPSPLIAIIVVTAFVLLGGFDLRSVGDMGALTRSLPEFFIPNVPFNLETLLIVLPFSITLAIVGMLESLLTATVVDEMTDTKSDKNREIRGQGIANTITGFFGGMAGCAMIGQSVINVKSGGRGRLSSLVAGVFLLFLILVLGDLVVQIPMAALVGVMIMVCIGTFDWGSIRNMRKVPLTDTAVMLTTVGVTVYTHDLARGVLAGVVLSAILFGWRIARIRMTSEQLPDGSMHYRIHGQMFFGTMLYFVELFPFNETADYIVIDFSGSHLWDQSAVNAVSKVVLKYEQLGKHVTLTGMNDESKQLMERIGVSASGH